MPIVTIRVSRESTTPKAVSVTAEQKAAVIKGASQLPLYVPVPRLANDFGRS